MGRALALLALSHVHASLVVVCWLAALEFGDGSAPHGAWAFAGGLYVLTSCFCLLIGLEALCDELPAWWAAHRIRRNLGARNG